MFSVSLVVRPRRNVDRVGAKASSHGVKVLLAFSRSEAVVGHSHPDGIAGWRASVCGGRADGCHGWAVGERCEADGCKTALKTKDQSFANRPGAMKCSRGALA